MALNTPKKASPEDWHPADIKAALEKKGWTLRALAAHHGIKGSSSLSHTFERSFPLNEKRIADGCPSDAHRGPWTHDEAPTAYYEAMMHGVVGLELRVTEVKGRFKLGQNRTELDRSGASAGLRERGRGQDLAVADAMDAATPLYEG